MMTEHVLARNNVQADYDRVTYKLFSPFRREVGIPSRSAVYSWYQFKKFVDNNNGINDCYVAVYPFETNVRDIQILDRVFFDFDARLVTIDRALNSAKVMFNLLQNYGIPVVPIATGSKGIQLHGLLKPETYEQPKSLLKTVTLNLIKEAFKGTVGLKDYLDPRPIGDISRIGRIPCTLRPPENKTWSSYLPPDFNNVSPQEVIEHMLNPKTYDYGFDNRKVALSDIDLSEDHTDIQLPEEETPTEIHYKSKLALEPVEMTLTIEKLRHIIRPCLFRNLQLNEPPHPARVAATVDLVNMGFKPVAIATLYRKFGWVDFDWNKTMYQIGTIYDPITKKSKVATYYCSTLRRLRIPRQCCVG